MASETVVVDMTGRTVESEGEVLPIVWWGDDESDPCAFAAARKVSAGPDRDGLYVQVSLDATRGRIQ